MNDRQRALAAQHILDDEIFQEAWKKGREHYFERMEAEKDPLERDKIWQALKILGIVRSHFENLVRSGEADAKIHAFADKEIRKIDRGPLDFISGAVNVTRRKRA